MNELTARVGLAVSGNGSGANQIATGIPIESTPAIIWGRTRGCGTIARLAGGFLAGLLAVVMEQSVQLQVLAYEI